MDWAAVSQPYQLQPGKHEVLSIKAESVTDETRALSWDNEGKSVCTKGAGLSQGGCFTRVEFCEKVTAKRKQSVDLTLI